jgi:hypothetical protein
VAIRLGEYNLLEEEDCTDGTRTNCTTVVDVPIDTWKVHELYNPDNNVQHHDIALIRLNETVTFTDHIQPICLPKTQNMMQKDLVNDTMVIAGWGRTEKGNYLRPIPQFVFLFGRLSFQMCLARRN